MFGCKFKGVLLGEWLDRQPLYGHISSVHGGPGSGDRPLRREDGLTYGRSQNNTFALFFYSVNM